MVGIALRLGRGLRLRRRGQGVGGRGMRLTPDHRKMVTVGLAVCPVGLPMGLSGRTTTMSSRISIRRRDNSRIQQIRV